MQTRSIGSLHVSVVGIGCNNFGRQLDLSATREVIHAALDNGITFFDTADSYGKPMTSSECFIGDVLKPHRNQVVIATKFGRVLDAQRHGAKPDYVRSATEASLKRLQTDHIDLLQLHIPDPETPLEDTLGALNDLVKQGKVREIGCSNFTADELRNATRTARAKSIAGFSSTQDEYSMLYRKPVAEILEECRQADMKFIPFRPLYNGLLTGRYGSGSAIPVESRIGAKGVDDQAQILSKDNLDRVALLTKFAQEHGRTLLELAFSWLLSHNIIPSIIAGVSSPSQVISNAAAADGRHLNDDEIRQVNAILG